MSDTVDVFLTRLHHPKLASIDLSLDRMHRMLSLLGSPQKRLPPVIHAAGTNGKGSLLAYLQAIMQAAGYKVHRYSSPHLVHFRERIILQGREIDNARLEPILKHVAGMLQNQPATFFEATTAAAFLAFAESPADILLMETGMGGRLDATNVITPLVSAITPISLDHCEFLGNTIEEIAGEKAGIIKPGVPCVVGRQGPEAAGVIERAAIGLNAPLYRLGQEWQVQGRDYSSPKRTLTLNPSLAGAHQFDNAATAVACLDMLPQFVISDEHIRQGLGATSWPARLQNLDSGRFARALPPGFELWLDGGHNPQGGEVLGAWLAEQTLPVYLICGMMKGKDSAAYMRPLAPHAQSLTGIAIPGETGSKTAEQVEMAARGIGMQADSAPSVEKALQTVVQHARTPGIICICGSLYLAGKVLAADKI